MKILVTGAIGFIGYHLTTSLLSQGYQVIGVDNINDYYSTELKYSRLERIHSHSKSKYFKFIKLDIADKDAILDLFKNEKFDIVFNLAAQAGVRYSIDNPHAYVKSNLLGFSNILEGCRHNQIKHLIYASSSSVYGLNKKQPFSTSDRVDYPISLYAATKKSNELMAHSYSHLFGFPTTGLRFFTVYGPFGRPDMAYYKFTQKIIDGETIDVYNNGNMKRDFTYIDDIIEGLIGIMDTAPSKTYRLFNIGNNNPITLREFISAIEKAVGKKAKENLLPMQPGDVIETYADIDDLIDEIGFKPSTSIEDGINKFVEWYKAKEL